MSAAVEPRFTFLFTDIEGSTRMWERDASTMSSVLAAHDHIMREVIHTHCGHIFKTMGDAFCVAFTRVNDALNAAVAAQKGLNALPVRVRMALHTGTAEQRDADYFGPTLNRVARILSAGHGGQILLSGATNAELAHNLPSDVELRNLGSRRLRDVNEPIHIFHALVADLPGNFTPLKSLNPTPTNLPAALTSFVGREHETSEIATYLRRPDIRLLTLVGFGGIGKTRLALQTAANLRDEFEHGVFFVALGTITQPNLLLNAVVSALGLEESENLPGLLKDYLRERHILLVFDNFEHILDAAPVINELLASAPRAKALTTSREALFIYGEHTYNVPALRVPHEGQTSAADWQQFPSMALFGERVRAALPDFAADEANAQAAGTICRLLDGVPLAIELAAARIRHMSIDEIAAQLVHRLTLLNSGPRDLPKRQQTMRGAIDWSYDLLARDEREIFAQLGVFVGQFSSEAADALADSAYLTRLVNASLMREVEGGYEMLGVLREYALERLAANGDLLGTQRRHAHYYRHYLETAAAYMLGLDQARWYDALEVAHPNCRAALEWSLAQGEAEIAARITAVLWRLWVVHSHLSEGQQWFKQVLVIQDQLLPGLRADILHGAGRLEFFRSNWGRSEKLLKESLAFYQSVDDTSGQATCLLELGEIQTIQGNYAQAESHFAESLAFDDARIHARLRDNLGMIAQLLGNYYVAELFYRESLEFESTSGSTEGRARVLNNLAEMLRAQGKFTEAIDHYNQSLQIYRALNFSFGIGLLLLNLAATEADQGNDQHALNLYRESLGVLRDLDETPYIISALIGLAGSELRLGHVANAAHICATVTVLLDNHQLTLDAADQAEYDCIPSQLDEIAWLDAQAKVRAIPSDHVLAYALAI